MGDIMKIQKLDEHEPLRVIDVSNPIQTMIKTKIYTDGEIEGMSEEEILKISEFYFGRKKYQRDVDTLKSKDIYFKNHNYIITYLIAKEWLSSKNGDCCGAGWYDIIKKVSIYLKNSNDKEALRMAKQTIREIAKSYNILNTDEESQRNFDTEYLSTDVYQLRRRK